MVDTLEGILLKCGGVLLPLPGVDSAVFHVKEVGYNSGGKMVLKGFFSMLVVGKGIQAHAGTLQEHQIEEYLCLCWLRPGDKFTFGDKPMDVWMVKRVYSEPRFSQKNNKKVYTHKIEATQLQGGGKETEFNIALLSEAIELW